MEKIVSKKTNHLINEKSPYLLQHAYNPVNWYPWCDEAFELAQKENKPIFLSVGYSTCHWCHVMEHESFEDEEVAKLMNDTFISIKVDREERPDIDNIYMTVCQFMTGHGGWPLTVLMSPDKKPFFSGTYFSKQSRHGRIGMMDLIPRIKDAWTSQNSEILKSAEHITSVLKEMSKDSTNEDLPASIFKAAFKQFNELFDPVFGGFGSAPKFPSPHNLTFLLRYYERTKEEKALQMVEKTLQSMRLGGFYDHAGFGFHRYSTDEKWLVPHFEKMLYDQAMLLIAYAETYQLTGKIEYAKTAKEILEYVSRDMTSPESAFYSAEDADSEGIEGKFYVWSKKELSEILSTEEFEVFEKAFSVTEEGNFLEEATKQKTGENILSLNKPLEKYSKELNLEPEKLKALYESARIKLFNERKKRIHPHKDDKILTSWNSLMIVSMAKASIVLNEPEYLKLAEKALNSILKNHYINQKLFHCLRGNQKPINAFLDDYAFLIWALLELYSASFDTKHLENAIKFTDNMIDLFFDREIGGFNYTSSENEELLVKQKEVYDGAIPSGNSIALLCLITISKITGKKEFQELANKTVSCFAKNIKRAPIAHSQFLSAYDFLLNSSFEIVIVGDKANSNTQAFLSVLNKFYKPNKILLLKQTGDKAMDKISPFTKHYSQIDGLPTVYVCKDFSCSSPTNNLNRMIELITCTQSSL